MLRAEGPLLTVDASTHAVHETDCGDVLGTFVGGRGVGTKLAYDRIPFDADPYGEENRLFFTTGPLQASRTSFTGRMSCTGLSPLTGGLLSSNAGGFLSRNFVSTGYAAVEISGASDEPVAIHVRDGVDGSDSSSSAQSRPRVEIEPVPELEGALVSEVTDHVHENHDLDAENVACIGPAGENLVRFASIMTSEHRTFGRGGLGAVLGSKNVKAITFDGTLEPALELPAVASEIHREAATSDSVMKRQGTAGLTAFANEVGALPTRYFSELSFEGSDGIDGDRVETRKSKRGTCSQCAFACKLPTRDEGTGLETEGPEYETVMAFGSNCAVDDVVSVMQSNELCDEFGMDTISCGDVVSAYLASEERFGDSAFVHGTVERIAHREGIGDLLAEGIDRAHDELGVRNWTAKGMEFAAHDGRALNGQALAFATANRGADHLYGSMYVDEYPLVPPAAALDPEGFEGKAERLVEKENHNAVLDSGIVCRFSRDVMGEDRLAAVLDADYGELLEVGGRIVDLERRFNNERGFDRADDSLPYDLSGFETALSEYYEARGWNDDGVVPPDRVDG